MAQVLITIRAESPLSLGTVKAYGGTLIESGSFVSGGQLRGALAALKSYASADEKHELDELLGKPNEAGICFPNCYLTNSRPAYPVPLTARTCKQHGGLRGEKKQDRKRHGVADTLLMQLSYDRIARDGERFRIPLPFQYKCPACGNRTQNYSGIVEYRGGGEYSAPELYTHRQTRAAINRARLTAEDGQLYSVRAIDEGSQFMGFLEVDETRLEVARRWLKRIARIGGRTSRGFGRVKVTVRDAEPTMLPSLDDRIRDFNQRYREFEANLIDIAHQPPEPETRILFTVNLRADALLRTQTGLPTVKFDEILLRDTCQAFLNDADGQKLGSMRIEAIAHYTQAQHVSGWQTAWKLPKEVLLASQMGGLYLFAVDVGEVDDARSALLSVLRTLEQFGIGEMREDGYGQVIICDPFHLEVNPV